MLFTSVQWLHKVEIKLRISSIKRPTVISEHLRIVVIKCEVVDNRVLKLIKFLSAFNICKIPCNAPLAFIVLTFNVMSICMKESMQPMKLVRKL